jgi:hypothetical protein
VIRVSFGFTDPPQKTLKQWRHAAIKPKTEHVQQQHTIHTTSALEEP